MKSRWIKIALSLLVVAVVTVGAYWQVRFNKDWREQYAYVKGVDAMVYAFPYFLNSVLLYKGSLPSDDPAVPSDLVNQFWHAPGVIDPKVYRDGGSPNRDTIYSAVVIYAADEPVVISVPPIPDERYYTLEIAGFDSDNFAYVGKRTHGNGGGNYAIVPPGWEGELPADVEYLAENPTPWFLILARLLIDPNDPEDAARVKALQAQYKLTALSDWGSANPPRPPHPPIDDVGELSDMLASGGNAVEFIKKMALRDPMAFWQVVNRAMTVNGIPERDQSRLGDWARLHIGPNQDIAELSDSERAGLSRATLDGLMILSDVGPNAYDSKQVNGWFYPDPAMGRAGTKGAYLTRSAIQSMKGIAANDPEEAVYMYVKTDQYGEKINGKHDYEIHFSPQHIPQAKEFWSLTLYDEDGNLVLNPIDRYSVGDRSEHLVYNADGGLTIYVGQEAPAGKESNWLPSDDQDFSLVLRAYGPGQGILDQTWEPPNVRRL